MKNAILKIALENKNGIARSRAKRILRMRYKITLAPNVRRDPVWLSAYN